MSGMRQVNVHEAKTNLSKLLEAVERGEDVVISRAGTPVVRLIPFVAPTRRLGGDKGLVTIAKDFDAPLPPDLLSDFER